VTGVVVVDSPEEVDDDDVELEVVDVLAVELLVVPGIVLALMAPNRPTPMTALIAAPVVSRLRRRMAASRARTLAWVVSLVSMGVSLDAASKSRLRGSWDIAEKNGLAWRLDTPPMLAPAVIRRDRNPRVPAHQHRWVHSWSPRPHSSGDRAGRS
jgi:hypothetical protein